MHEGWIITESNDILFYLEEKHPTPTFLPSNATQLAQMNRWMAASASLHIPAIKTFNYSRMNLAASIVSSKDLEHYRALQTDQELLTFHEKASRSGFSVEERSRAQGMLNKVLQEMDSVLTKQNWLAGDAYSLADICWVTTIPTLVRSGFDMMPFSHVRKWHEQIAERPSYTKAITDWENSPV
jgi:glutathione S-transferase